MDRSTPDDSSSEGGRYTLLMEHEERHNTHEHIVEVRRNDDIPSNSYASEQRSGTDFLESGDRHSTSSEALASQALSNQLNSRNSFTRRGDSYGRRRRSPLNSGLWISVELVVTLAQIIASIVVLSISKDEKPKAPLFAWIIGYALGCVATLPILYCRFRNHNQGIEQDSIHVNQGSSPSNMSGSAPYTAVSVTQPLDEESNNTIEGSTRNSQSAGLSMRINGLVDNFKMALDCFFAVWFVVGNVWIFGGHTSPSDAPNLYRLCIVFLTFSCIGYAMPFILCATICCCLPCIISVLGFREDISQTRGASLEVINALPTYKFKSKSENGDDQDNSINQGGILSAGTEKERFISGEDAVCCICLAKYADGDELRELQCFHVFHVECVDKWLKINASCPLCKSEVGESSNGEESVG